ncbi:MAG: flagellar hook-basal body complex protein FliE [Myxococcales bacterium]|nr:flagellar hook-basal body complex protein FliE [Myxococcales bacterium]
MSDLRITTPAMIAMPKLDLRGGEQGDPSGGFASVLSDALHEANAVQQSAETEARELAAGRGDALAAVMAVSRADLSLKFITGIRNRALEAFNEIIRMPV